MTKRVALLISGGGSNMLALARSMGPDHPGKAALVLSNVPDAGGLARAQAMGLATDVIDHREFAGDRVAFDAALNDRLGAAGIDLVCLAGFMRILSPEFVQMWQGRLLNIHPSLLPKYKGLNTHKRALEAGDTAHGCTVHHVTPELDAGTALGQARLTIHPDDTAETLAARVLTLEHQLYPEVLRRHLSGGSLPVVLSF